MVPGRAAVQADGWPGAPPPRRLDLVSPPSAEPSPPSLSAGAARLGRQQSLSNRELDVVWHLAAGRRAAEIALTLQISHNTVRSHVRNAMAKTGARSQAHLVAIALIGEAFEGERLRQLTNALLADYPPR